MVHSYQMDDCVVAFLPDGSTLRIMHGKIV